MAVFVDKVLVAYCLLSIALERKVRPAKATWPLSI